MGDQFSDSPLDVIFDVILCLLRRKDSFGYIGDVGLAGSDQFPFGTTCCTEICMPILVVTSCVYIRLFLCGSTEVRKQERNLVNGN